MIKSNNFKYYIIVIICLSFLSTGIFNSWFELPCAPNCNSEDMAMGHNDHNFDTHMNHESKIKHHNADSLKPHMINSDTAHGCEECEKCQNFYQGLFSFMSIQDNNLITVIPTSIVEIFTSNSLGHTPDPYKTPPA